MHRDTAETSRQTDMHRFLEESILTSIMKYAKYGAAVVASFAIAVALLVSSAPRTAEAATLTVTSINYLRGSSVPTATTFVTVAAAASNQAIPNSGKIAITFPTGTVFGDAATTAASWSVDDATGAGDAAEAPASAAVSGTTLTLTLDGSSTIAAGEAFSVATAAVGLIKFAATSGSLQVATLTAAGAALDSGSANLTLDTVTVTASPTSVAADGVSTSAISVGASVASNAGLDTVSVVTNQGVFTAASAAVAGSLFATMTAITAPATVTTATGVTANGGINVTASTFTLRASTTASTVTITVYITPAGGGQAQIAGVGSLTLTAPAQVAPGLPASGSVTPTTAVTIISTGTTATITATFVDGLSNTPIPGGALSVSTNLGNLTAGTGVTTCTNQSCSGTLAANGAASVTLTGGGVAGTATITFTTNGVNLTKSVLITGALDRLVTKMQTNTAASTTYIDSATPNATTYALNTNTGVRLFIQPLDVAGSVIPGVAPTATFAPATCGASQGTITSSTAGTSATTSAANIIVVLTSPTAGTACTATVSATFGGETRTGTVAFTIGGTAATTNVLSVDAADAATATAQTVKVTVKDSSGRLVADGTSVSLVASAGGIVSTSATTKNGVADFTYVTPGTAQVVGLTGVMTVSGVNLTASKVINVTTTVQSPATPPATAGAFSGGTIAATGVSIVSFTGTAAQLNTAGAVAKVVSASATVGGKMITFVVGAPDFVNAEFNAAFPTGLTATLVIVKTGA